MTSAPGGICVWLLAAAPLTVAIALVVTSSEVVGFVTVQVGQVPVLDVTVFLISNAPASGDWTRTVKVVWTLPGPVLVAAGTSTSFVQLAPSAVLGEPPSVQVQPPGAVGPTKLVWAGTVSVRVVLPAPPWLVVVIW